LTLLEKVPRSENSEENSEESRLFTGTNSVLRPASISPIYKMPFSTKHFCYFPPNFARPPSGARIPIKPQDKSRSKPNPNIKGKRSFVPKI
jgi:hypothetical protein